MSLSAAWTRGPRCGVQNCRSRLWRTVNGQKACQNGHIREGEIDMEEDEDAFFGAGGRRMTMGGGASQMQMPGNLKTESTRLYGAEGLALQLKCFQLILKLQIKWLIEHQNAPLELEHIARGLFGLYINSADETIVMSEASDGERRRGRGGPSRKSTKQPVAKLKLLSIVAISYLSCCMLRLPIYLYDFQRWISHFRFPYMQVRRLIPTEMHLNLGMHILPGLRPRTVPMSGQIYDAVLEVSTYLFNQYRVEFPPTLLQPLAFKMIRDLFLPREYQKFFNFDSLLTCASRDISSRNQTVASYYVRF